LFFIFRLISFFCFKLLLDLSPSIWNAISSEEEGMRLWFLVMLVGHGWSWLNERKRVFFWVCFWLGWQWLVDEELLLVEGLISDQKVVGVVKTTQRGEDGGGCPGWKCELLVLAVIMAKGKGETSVGEGQRGWLKQAIVIVVDNERVAFWLHEDDVDGTAI